MVYMTLKIESLFGQTESCLLRLTDPSHGLRLPKPLAFAQ